MISPGSLKSINELLEAETKGRGKVETLAASVAVGDGEDEDVEEDMSRPSAAGSSLMEGARRLD